MVIEMAAKGVNVWYVETVGGLSRRIPNHNRTVGPNSGDSEVAADARPTLVNIVLRVPLVSQRAYDFCQLTKYVGTESVM